MILIVTIDDRFGMAFNNRRLSQDKEQQKRMLEMTEGGKLRMNAYSKKLFPDCDCIDVDEDFLEKAVDGDYCFTEVTDVSGYDFEKIILYRWNRRYMCRVRIVTHKYYTPIKEKMSNKEMGNL